MWMSAMSLLQKPYSANHADRLAKKLGIKMPHGEKIDISRLARIVQVAGKTTCFFVFLCIFYLILLKKY